MIKQECERIRKVNPKINDFTDDEIIAFEEYAGVYEFELNMLRFKAEKQAYERVILERDI